MRYSYDDQYNVLIKSTSNLSSSNSHIPTDFAAIDYFQFEFNELQLHNCWKLVHRQRINETFIPQSTDVTRLENLSWRRWTKMKYELEEVTPESVDWYKDCDITWLYGPLVSSRTSEQDFGFHKKPATLPFPAQLPSRRNDSVLSLSSTSSVESSPFFSDVSDDEEEEELLDEKSLSVKPILKHRYSYGPLGFENLDHFKKNNLKSTPKFKKSVSFADMVQIRCF